MSRKIGNPPPWWEAVPGRCSGQPVFTGTRIPIDTVRALLARGFTVERIAEMYPDVPVASLHRVHKPARRSSS